MYYNTDSVNCIILEIDTKSRFNAINIELIFVNSSNILNAHL